MSKIISDIYNLIQELSWYFGNQGFDGTCCDGLSLVEFMTMKKVYETDQISIQEIGNALNITKSGVSKIIDRLEAKDYVTRKQSPIDGRICCVVITDKGIDIIKRIIERYDDYINKVFSNIEPSKIEDVKNTLELLMTSLRSQGFIKPN